MLGADNCNDLDLRALLEHSTHIDLAEVASHDGEQVCVGKGCPLNGTDRPRDASNVDGSH